MKIHEYQGKEILRQFGIPVPRGIPAFTVQEAVEAAQKLGGPVWVVKAQIHAGGRGKVVGRLGAAVQHHHQRQGCAVASAGHVKLVGPLARGAAEPVRLEGARRQGRRCGQGLCHGNPSRGG